MFRAGASRVILLGANHLRATQPSRQLQLQSHFRSNLEALGSDQSFRRSMTFTLGVGLSVVGGLFVYGQYEVRKQQCVWDAFERAKASVAVQQRIGPVDSVQMGTILSGNLRTDPLHPHQRRTAEISFGLRGPLGVATVHFTAHTELDTDKMPDSSVALKPTEMPKIWLLDNLSITCPQTSELIILLENGKPPQFILPNDDMNIPPDTLSKVAQTPSIQESQSIKETPGTTNATDLSPNAGPNQATNDFPLLYILLAAAIGTPLMAGSIYLTLRWKRNQDFKKLTHGFLEHPELVRTVGSPIKMSGAFRGLWQPADSKNPQGVASVVFNVVGPNAQGGSNISATRGLVEVHVQAVQNEPKREWNIQQANAIIPPHGRRINLLDEPPNVRSHSHRKQHQHQHPPQDSKKNE